jgi:protein phosphatase
MARLSIGDFARVSGLTPKALRLYGDLGLLRPAEVDPRSGYRWYEEAQLERARLVASLRGLGMPLARISVLCDLPPGAAAAEIASYWRQVEADTAARKVRASRLIEDLARKETDMTGKATLDLAAAARTDRGLVREGNQDVAFRGNRLFAIADGFGARGTVPAAGSAAMEAISALEDSAGVRGPLEELQPAWEQAQAAVQEFTDSDASRKDGGTTLTAMLWSGAGFGLAHVGDSRAYLLRNAELMQLTHDHTYVQSLVDEGKLTAEETATHPDRATLLRALHRDAGESSKPDMHLREAQPGDRYLLCTDGLHAVVDGGSIRQALQTFGTADETVDRLVKLVYDAGAPDNLACIVIDVLGTADA